MYIVFRNDIEQMLKIFHLKIENLKLKSFLSLKHLESASQIQTNSKIE